MGDPKRVAEALGTFAFQEGVNTFWGSWDEAGHFELDDDDEGIWDDHLAPALERGARRWCVSAFYTLPGPVRAELDVRRAAAEMIDAAWRGCREALAAARVDVDGCPRADKDRRVFDGEVGRPVTWSRTLGATLRAGFPEAPGSDTGAPVPEVVGGPVEALLAVLGPPVEIAVGLQSIELLWDRAEASVSTLGLLVEEVSAG